VSCLWAEGDGAGPSVCATYLFGAYGWWPQDGGGVMTKMDWSDGGRPTPEMSRVKKKDINHEKHVQRLTLSKYKKICRKFPNNTFARSVLRQIENQGWISKRQAQILMTMEAKK